MNELQLIFTIATLAGALGMWFLLPGGSGGRRLAGAALMAIALGLWASQIAPLGDWVANSVFAILAAVTVVAAIGTITFRNPIYCAIWFGMTLLGTAGLFLFIGAQFLAVATIVVYAGAILVMFLFVLMLAQPEGRAAYDRVSWEAMLSAATGIVMVGVLSMTVSSVLTAPEMTAISAAADLDRGVLAPQHVVHLGAELFGRHLIAVEVAGTLLLAALVGAAVIVTQGRTEPRQQQPLAASQPNHKKR